MNEQVKQALDRFVKYYNGKDNAHWQKIFERAYALFEGAECENDFCLQHANGCVVFGGSNRLFWDRSTNTFRASEAHCSDAFIRHVEENK